MLSPDKKLLIFDFDGTLNTGADLGYDAIIEASLEENGIRPNLDNLKRFIESRWGNSPRLIVRDLAQAITRSRPHLEETRPTIVDDILASYNNLLQKDFAEYIRPIPGAVEMLGRLASRHLLALNTAADEEVLYSQVMPNLAMNRLELFRGGAITALDVEDGRISPKPEPDSTRELMARNQVEPHETVMIGDSASDILAAAYAGVEDIVVTLTGRLSSEEAEQYRHEYGIQVIPDVSYLEQILGNVSLRPLVANGS